MLLVKYCEGGCFLYKQGAVVFECFNFPYCGFNNNNNNYYYGNHWIEFGTWLQITTSLHCIKKSAEMVK